MPYKLISDFVYDCNVCPTRCDGVSKGTYIFGNDTSFSEKYEQIIIDKINRSGRFVAKKSVEEGYPDVEISAKDGKVVSYLEVKVQQRTFMSIEEKLPASGLKPSETVALNLSDLLRYFEIKDKTGIKTSIVWGLMNRLCIVNQGEVQYFHQNIDVLREIYSKNKESRRFKRRSGEGDVVNGVHKGVTVNYHFSLKELKLWEPGKI